MQSQQPVGNKFGTFGGVFTPSILTILGVIMFMRAGFVVGEAGVLGALAILIIAKTITVLTSLSVAAICTNMQVQGGGAYFLISRVMGPEFGGAIGIALFLAQALSVPFYILGFAEALVLSFPVAAPWFLPICLVTALLLFVISYVGAGWAIKAQYLIMGILGLSLLSFFGGMIQLYDPTRLAANWKPLYTAMDGGGSYSFWIVFAIYFPAVTGILAGINMSGDLKDPARSIPWGTLYAVGAGALIYAGQIWLSGAAFVRTDLIVKPFEMLKDSAIGGGALVVAGVFAATLSSALGSYLGAPRILQAVSRDGILPVLRSFAVGAGPGDEPRRALMLTGLITVVVLFWAGDSGGGGALNAVAAVISMFFLYTYGMINLAAFIEAFGENPSFRPTFRFFSWHTALLGTLGCAGAALLIDLQAAAGAVIVLGCLFWYLRRREMKVAYADARRGFVYSRVRHQLIRLARTREDPRNWRPTILVFSGNPANRSRLVSYAEWLESGRGIVFLANVLVGDLDRQSNLRAVAARQLEAYCAEESVDAFPCVLMSPSFEQGVSAVLQTVGVGPLRPNLVMFGWGPEPGGMGRALRRVRLLGQSIVLLRTGTDGNSRRIDVWWRGRKNGSLLVMLAWLLTRNWEWAGHRVRVIRLVDHERGCGSAREALEELIREARVDVDVCVLVSDRPFPELLRAESADAACVFMGFEPPPRDDEDENWHARLAGLLEGMPTVVLASAAEREENIE